MRVVLIAYRYHITINVALLLRGNRPGNAVINLKTSLYLHVHANYVPWYHHFVLPQEPQAESLAKRAQAVINNVMHR